MLVLNLTAASAASASDWVYFSAVDDITSLLIQKINAETVRIDMSAWYLTEHSISIALINRFNAGVQVRLIGDRGSLFEIDALTKNEFYWLASQGVPIRLRYHPTWVPEIDHWKATIFAGQNLVTFGSANYTPFELAPTSSTNYKDEIVLFSDDSSLVGAFKTKFDRYWNDTTPEPESLVGPPPYFLNWDQACARESACADYRSRYPAPRPMAMSTARLEPDYPMPPDMIWGQGPAFNGRLIHEISVEPNRVDMVIYRLTVDSITETLLNKFRSGVPVRLIVEPNEYLNRNWPEFWLTHANLDKLWAAGVPMKQRVHEGLTHMKTLVTSSYATIASSNFAAAWQRDHNYFLSAAAKPAAYQAIANRFQVMWNNAGGFAPFQPQPPDSPTLQAPAAGVSGVNRRPALVWQRAPFAVSYDVYLGTSPGSMAWVANVPAQLVNEPPATYSWTPPIALAPGTIHYWTIVSRTFANLTAAGPTWSFTTSSSTAPDGSRPSDIVVFRPLTGTWHFLYSKFMNWSAQWGAPGDIPLSADFDADRVTDLTVFRPSTAEWFVRYSSLGYSPSQYFHTQWGILGDIPLVADFDRDGVPDLTVFRPSSAEWYVRYSSLAFSSSTYWRVQWGIPGDIPLVADWDNDRIADLTVYRPTTGEWFVRYSKLGYSGSTFWHVQWGAPGDIPLIGDFDGDRLPELTVFRPSTGQWLVRYSSLGYSTAMFWIVQWGAPGDRPFASDFDGDGLADLVVFRPSTAQWFGRYSAAGYSLGATGLVQWGVHDDIPVTR